MTRRTHCLAALAIISASMSVPDARAQLNPVSPGGGLIGPGNAMGDQSGSAVSIDGTSAIIGSRYDDNMGDSSGTASVFRFNGSSWVYDGLLLATDGAAYDQFGASVAVSGIWALVGAPTLEDVSVSPYPDIGAVYVFKRTNGVWQQTQRLFASNPRTNDLFGLAIAMSGTVAVCGTTKDAGGTLQGAAYVFRLNGSTWTMEQKLTAAAGGTYTFGASVAIQGNRIAVGAPNETNNGILFSGAAYVYDFNGSTWQQKQRLVPTDATASDNFGFSVAVDNDTIAIGATGDDDRGANSGSVYLFKFNGSTWSQSQKLLANDGTASDLFGWCASMSQGLLLVGAKDKYGPPLYTGAAYAFRKLSTTYSFENRLVLPTVTSSDNFGAAVSAAGNVAIVGNPGSDFTTFNGGRAWLYSSGGASNTAPSLTVSSPANGASYGVGQSVSFSASATDAQDGNLTSSIQWTSNLQSPSLIGTGGSFSKSNLVAGTHTITIRVTDSGGLSSTQTRTITISSTNSAPVVTVFSPANNSSYAYGATVSFSASASDAQDGNLTSSITWISSLQGQFGSGGSFTKNNLVAGTHTITARVTDSGGMQGTAFRTVTIVAPPSNTPPTVTISSPANNYTAPSGTPILFSATASDAQDGNISNAIVWTSSLQGQIGVGSSIQYSALTLGTHTITARVTDSGGLQGTATRTVIITAPLLPPVDTVASSQTAVSGSVTGSYTLTHTANSQHQSIQEVETNGNPNSRYSYLEHKWVFSVPTGGTSRSFHVKAYQSVSTDGDNFAFAYSTNNSTWTNMVTLTGTSTSGSNLSFTLPATLSGTVNVRVKDTDQAAGHRELNTVYIDHMYIRKQ